jgi:iron complex outermembrane receptor protein
MKILLIAIFCIGFLNAFAQTDPVNKDTVFKANLENVLVKAYEQSRRLQDVAAAVNFIGRSDLSRYNNTNILPAVNATPGVRMEERSPGSYRLNIRGSSLRSPFGVRNVKVYYNNIPFTDPGGHTFLNQVGFYNVQSIEIIKGPGSSLYGAGTGGVMLIESPSTINQLQLNYTTGSYNLQNVHASASLGNANFSNTISYQHQTSDGYRQHTNMRRDVFSWNSTMKAGDNGQLSTSFLYGDLYYQTPGALTLSEYNQDPRSARPTIGSARGSVAAKAAIYEKTFLVGATLKQQLNNEIENSTTLYGAFTQLKNPSIRNYGRNNEPHFGGRTIFQFKEEINKNLLLVHTGAELQQGYTTSRIFSNKGGNPDTLQTDDEINNRQAFIFSQVSWQHKQWLITAGASLNQLDVEFTRLSKTPVTSQSRKYNNELAPRLAILRKVGETLSIYGSISKGFSPPSTAELLPGDGNINASLNAERGINYETGFKGSFLKGAFTYDINTFLFKLKNTIVQRRDASGGDFFINAGSTDQKGLETLLNYKFNTSYKNQTSSKLWVSHTWNNFKYAEFKQLANDFSGKQLPSISRHTVAAGLDLFTKQGFYLNMNYFYSDPIFLNDANTAKANAYNLVGSKVGFKRSISNKYSIDLFAGVDNLFDVNYSLGNDINAFGNRFYNAASNRNYYGGISFRANGNK